MDKTTEGDRAFAKYRFFLRVIGVWALEKKSVPQTTRYVVASAVQVTFLLHTLTEIILNNGSVSYMLDMFFFCSSACIAFVKHTCLHVYRDAIGENLKFYLDDWSCTKDEAYLQIMREHFKIYKIQFNAYIFFSCVGVSLFISRAVLTNIIAERQLQPGEAYVNQLMCPASYLSNETLVNYYPALMAVQCVQFFYCCTSSISADSFFFGLVLHLCGQFEILKIKWKRLWTANDTATNSDFTARRQVDNASRVKELIIRHKELLKLGENLEASFNNTILIQLLFSIVLMCMSGCIILIALSTKSPVTLLIYTNSISYMVIEALLYGYASDYLTTQSESIVQAVYSSSWHDVDGRIKHNLIFVMMRAQIPVYITAGKFVNVTQNTVIQLIKTAGSFLSVLRLTLEMSNTKAQL